MQALNLEEIEHPDFVAFDKDGQIVLIAEVQGFPFTFKEAKTRKYAILRLIDYLQNTKILIPFAMLVDVENIQIFQWDGSDLSAPILCLNTVDVLSHYEPKFRSKKYLVFI
ncbi:MAG: hypothetical protein MET45_02570 [Nostoc sp. LLA-1]|nr:hypothetical protein [Cyanocohniella sp. LLY]